MKKIMLLSILLLLGVFYSFAQNSHKERAEKYLKSKGELTFTFLVENNEEVAKFTKNLSLVNYNTHTKTVTAWANKNQFRVFEALNIAYQVPKDENEVKANHIYDIRPLESRNMTSTLTFPLASYPTYAEYAQQMQNFEDDYPELVEKVSIGTTGQGDKELLFVKISDQVSIDEAEPKLMFTSSMHGDEIAGYPMMLTLIDYILTVYSNTSHADHARVKHLVENAEIWINPSANPDGTYHNSATNTSVANARRGNANNIDLNRNYPDNVAGDHPDGEVYQTETIAFMNFADEHNFVISANFHGGTELVNYPFDNAYATSQHTHADTDWYEFVGVEYATHCQTDANAGAFSTPTYNNKASYMTDDNDWDESAGGQAWHNNYRQSPGVTHGAEWYRVFGGRQDYMNVYKQCRETTIELSDTKILPESSLVDYWYYNRDALLDYLTQGTYGFRGLVKDSVTNSPIEGATITVVGHDTYGSEVSSDTNGDFYRPIKAGTYDLMISAPCYQSVTLNSQTITDYTAEDLANILLTPITPTIPENLNVTDIVSSSATLNWSSGSGSSYDVRYREVGASDWIEMNGISSNTLNLTGLNPETDYEYEVRANCGSSSSLFSNTDNFTTAVLSYCSAQGTNISDEYIGQVTLNGVSNNSENSTTSGYSNYRGSAIFSPIEIGSTGNTISVTKFWDSINYNEAVSAWIDYNQDGIFTNDEKILEEGASIDPQTVSTSFNVPVISKTGNTVMRVIMKYYNTVGSLQTDPCETFSYGEVEDYTVNLFENSLGELENDFIQIKVYPNPFDNEIRVKLPSTISFSRLDFRLYDVLGRTIQLNTQQMSNEITRLISTNNLTSGTYILKIVNIDTNQSITKQLIKQ